MSATLSKLRTSWVGKALLAYAVSALALVVLGLAAPGSAVFFPLVSLWCNLALFGLVLVVLRLAVPLGCDYRLLGRGAALLLLGRDPPQLRVHLGLRQLYQQAVQRRGRLSSGPGGRLPFHSGLSG